MMDSKTKSTNRNRKMSPLSGLSTKKHEPRRVDKATTNSEPNYITTRKKLLSPKTSVKVSPTTSVNPTQSELNKKCETEENQQEVFFTPPTISASSPPLAGRSTLLNLDLPPGLPMINSPLISSKSTPLRDCDTERETHVINISTNNTFGMLSEDEEEDVLDQQLLCTDCTLHKSCPDLTSYNLENSEEVKSMVNKLETDLASAHREIESLLSEKYTLSKQITGYRAKIQQLTLICKATSSPSDNNNLSRNTSSSFNSTLDTNQKMIKKIKKPIIAHQLHKNKTFLSPSAGKHKPEEAQHKKYYSSETELSKKSPSEDATSSYKEVEKILTTEVVKNTNKNLDGKSQTVIHTSSNVIMTNTKLQARSKVIILADQQGKGTRQMLQELLGSQYEVFSFLKSGATIADILSSCKAELSTLTTNDYVILIGFRNDTNLFSTRYILASWISSVQNTNIIVCETSFNPHLNENKLNYEVKFICSQFKNATFLDMSYARFKLSRFYNIELCRNILQDITRLSNHRKYKLYQMQIQLKTMFKDSRDIGTQTELVTLTDKITQTDQDIPNASISSTDRNDDINDSTNTKFFRDQ